MESSQKRILIIDDDFDIQDIFTEILTGEGYDISNARNGKDALSLLLACDPKRLPDLIILDSQMPEMNGHEFLNAIRDLDSESLKRISILLSSGNDLATDEGFPQEIHRMQKPVELDMLVDSVARSLNNIL